MASHSEDRGPVNDSIFFEQLLHLLRTLVTVHERHTTVCKDKPIVTFPLLLVSKIERLPDHDRLITFRALLDILRDYLQRLLPTVGKVNSPLDIFKFKNFHNPHQGLTVKAFIINNKYFLLVIVKVVLFDQLKILDAS